MRGQETKSRDKEKQKRAEERMAAVKALSSEQQPEVDDGSKNSKPSKAPPRKKGGSGEYTCRKTIYACVLCAE